MSSIFTKYKYRNQYKKLILACLLFYIFSITIKGVYNAQIVELIDFFGSERQKISFGLIIFYFVYAGAQLLLSLIINKINVKWFMIITTSLSAISFALIGISHDLWQLWLILGINGIFLCGSWGGIVYIVGKHLPNDILSYSYRVFAIGNILGTSIAYLISSLCIMFSSWKLSFVISAIFLVFALAFMIFEDVKTEKLLSRNDEIKVDFLDETNQIQNKSQYIIPEGRHFNIILIIGLLCVINLAVSCLLYGINSWIPSLLKEVHGFPNEYSILITLVVPLLALPSGILTLKYFDKTNKVLLTGIFGGFIVLTILVVMIFAYSLNMVFAIIMCILLRFFMNVLTSFCGSYTFTKFKNYISIGKACLINNAFGSLSAGFMPYVMGVVLDTFKDNRWTAYYIIMALLCLFTIILTFVTYIISKKKMKIDKWI